MRKWTLGLILVLVAIGTTCDPIASEGSDVLLIEGGTLDDNTFELNLEPGEVASNAVLVYSLPSRSLLAAFIDFDFGQTPDGEMLLDSVGDQGALAVIETDLPVHTPQLVLDSPPSDDIELQIALWGVLGEREISAIYLPAMPFDAAGFSLSVDPVEMLGGQLDTLQTFWCSCKKPTRDCGCATCPPGKGICDCSNCRVYCR